MLELSADICALFEADRLTVYATGDDGNSIVSKIKTGLTGFKDLNLPISPTSIAGYVAFHKQLVNIADVYDEQELAKFSQKIRFLKEVDQKTGYRTRQMLVAPILGEDGELLGVVQLINSLTGLPFPNRGGRMRRAGEALASPVRRKPGPESKPSSTLYRRADSRATWPPLRAQEELEHRRRAGGWFQIRQIHCLLLRGAL
jgi:hypothetical protein